MKKEYTHKEFRFSAPVHAAIVEARFYEEINDHLIAGAVEVLERAGATYEVVTVPGALETPAAVQMLAQRTRGKTVDAFVVLGAVIRGATTHYETVCNESARGLTDVALKYSLALGNGILTVETEAQAMERADKAQMNKGGGAAEAALVMLALKRESGV